MRPLSVPELLQVWENGVAQGPVDRALALLGAASPDTPADYLLRLSIGRRDASLMTLREWTFGSRVDSLVDCQRCGQRLELGFDIAEVRVDRDVPLELSAMAAGYQMRLRPPNSGDIAALSASTGLEEKRRLLFASCLMEAQYAGVPVPAEQLPAEALDAAAACLAEADPQADIQLGIDCSHCGYRWRSVFDIVTFFWSEIEAWAVRMLRDVHTLASAYGWSERDILSLSPARRRLYLEMVEA